MPRPLETALFHTISHPKKRAVLCAYVELGRVKAACAAAHTPFNMHYYWLKHDPAYAEAWQEAVALLAVSLEDEAIRRARDGVERPIFHQGVLIGTEHRYSDVLLIFLLKGAMPQKYADRTEITGAGGGPIQLVIQGDLGSGDSDQVQIPETASGTNGVVLEYEAL